MAFDPLAQPGHALAGPHLQRLLGPPHPAMPAMPGQPRQQAQRQRQQQPPPVPTTQIPIEPAQQQGCGQNGQGNRCLKQQQGAGCQSRQQAAPQQLGRRALGLQQPPPQQGHRTEECAIKHHQTAMAGQGQQRQGDHGTGQGWRWTLLGQQAPLHQGQERHQGR